MAREQKRLRRNSSQFIQQFSDSLQSGSTRRTGCCQNEIKKMRINQLSVSWQVTIRHENDVTHSYFQFNSLKFNSACFTGMNDDRLFAPKLHKSKLAGLNNKHLFQIYWEGVHVSVCVCDCASPPQLFTLLSLCVCVRVWECVCMCVTSRLWTQGGAVRPVLITRPPCAPCWCCCHPDVTVVGVKKAWRCVCVCVWIPGGLVFPLPLRDGSAPVWGTLIWTGPPLCDGTNHSTPRSLKPIIFLFKAGQAREAKRGEDGPCKKLPILSLEHGKNGLLARNRLMLNDPLRL